jgi:hypothetical protein
MLFYSMAFFHFSGSTQNPRTVVCFAGPERASDTFLAPTFLTHPFSLSKRMMLREIRKILTPGAGHRKNLKKISALRS